MGIPIFQVDAFTDTPFSGNPAGVCQITKPRDAAWMQLVAREMNVSETAFLVPRADGFDLRWFTPAVEVELCGHATLASAHILWETNTIPQNDAAIFHTASGILTASREGNKIELDFPATPDDPATPPTGLSDALGINPNYTGKTRFDYLIEVDSESTVRSLSPDFAILRSLPVRGVIVTSQSDTPGYDFISRFFAPAAGIDEDPVTGSAHCCLGPFWSRQTGKKEFVAFQASERGGTVHVRVAGERVHLGGNAVTVLRGELEDHS